MTQEQTIPEFFTGKNIFITGGSGFMGKVLIEKLLYSCSELSKIYLLLRDKKGVRSEERLQQMYSSPCFDRLRNEKPEIFERKVACVSGDVMEIGLGLSEEHRAVLIDNVNIIFHVAASVRFDDPLQYAAKLNLRGTREVVELAKAIKNLSVMVHVSTSYSNTNRELVEEVMYPPHADWREALEICDTVDEHTLRVLTPKYIGEMPNTYTFTKQLAEHVVYEQKGVLPATIIRPSIVISSATEPVPGWIENYNGPVGLLVASGKGIMRSLYTNPDLMADYIPVDVAIQTIITAAWHRGTKKLKPTDDIPIYNCCSGSLFKITMNEVVEMGRSLAKDMPLDGMLWSVGGNLTTSKTWHYLKVLILHLLPAVFVDTLLRILGRKPMLVKVQRRIYIANLALQYYLIKQWTFVNSNLVALRSFLKETDRAVFYFDIEAFDHRKFFYDSLIGAKKYLLKENLDDLPKARAHSRRLAILDFVVKTAFYCYCANWVMKIEVVNSAINSVINCIFY
ncbi:putative fatty acyl-CoA reductase CG5065 [Bombyx mandarina]|uniref:Fatty acyl-CoA reductase n=1 Tax=Bombyx mandarina TaxID=7092 RepID=A0A6J2K1S2_BOMMA|nr:putative fatty acyl-CoA reductase CG5065 [Bombyx mandarina]